MMNNFEIYVKTSAMGQTGIHWRHICAENEQPIETPLLVQDKILVSENGYPIIVNDLLDQVKHSLLIYRNSGKILLEVTGIESPKRSSRMGRKVLNLIVWVGKDNDENEKVIRKIAYSAIQNFLGNDSALSDMIQESIDFYEREEFRCDLTKVNDYVNKLDDFDSAQNPNFEQLIDIKSDDYLTRLAEDIKKYSLPKQWKASNGAAREEGVLVVVTEQLDQKDIFYQAEVWRGFASNVKKPSAIEVPKEVIISLPSIKTLKSEEKKTTIQAQSQHKNRRLIYLMIIMVIFILIVIMAFQTMRPKMLKPSPQKTPISQEKWHPPLIYPINNLSSHSIQFKVWLI